MTDDPSFSSNEEIDIRAIALILWKSRIVITIVTLAVAIAVFVTSLWILPRKYQASAYVFIGPPPVEFSKSQTASGLVISSSSLPDQNTVIQLSTAPNLLESVIKDPAVIAFIGNEDISLSDMAIAVGVGKDQVRLQITDTDSQRAALLANTWAKEVTNSVNAIYGLDAWALTLDSQVLRFQSDYNQAETTLEGALSKSPMDSLSAQLQQKQVDLNCALESTSQTTRVLGDLQIYEQELNGVPGNASLSLGDALALTTLRQRSMTSQPCQSASQSQNNSIASASNQNAPDFTVQIDSTSLTGFTVSKALEIVARMRLGLQSQLGQLQSDRNRLEQEIPQLHRDMESASAALYQLTLKRDQSLRQYTDLYQIQKQVNTVLTHSLQVARVSVAAVPPEKNSSPKVVLNTALAGILGLTLIVIWVLLQNWWQNRGDEEEEKKRDVSRKQER